jgi:hypothetical protein
MAEPAQPHAVRVQGEEGRLPEVDAITRSMPAAPRNSRRCSSARASPGWACTYEGRHITGKRGKLLIPLLPEHQRIGRKAFKRVIDGLMRAGNAFFIEKNGKVILMAENIKDNTVRAAPLQARRTGPHRREIDQARPGIPIAVLVPSVTLRGRFDLPGIVRAQLPKLATNILQQLNAQGL